MNSQSKKIRVSLDVSREIYKQLERLRAREETSFINVFRLALAVYAMLTDHVDKGGKVILEGNDGTQETIKFL